MERPFICGEEKYTISKLGTIGLPVSIENLPNEINVNGNKLFLKPSFHVSLVCIGQIVKKRNISVPNFRDVILEEFCNFTRTNEINFINYSEDFKYAKEDNLKTVVVMCNVSNLDKFFDLINKKYGLNLEYPPTHVTLYAHDGKTGIFLTDFADLKNLTKPIPNSIGHLL